VSASSVTFTMTTIRRRSAFDLIFADHGQVRISDDFPRNFVLSDRKYLIAPSGLAMIGLAMSDRLRRSFRIAVSSATRVKLAQTFAAKMHCPADPPIMGGTTHDEGTFSNAITEYFSGPPQTPMTAAQYVANVTNAYPPATATTHAELTTRARGHLEMLLKILLLIAVIPVAIRLGGMGGQVPARSPQ
jgi:hypothetical protein